MQIGQVAERTGLSLRTIRCTRRRASWCRPRARRGFRLYSTDDLGRLEVIKSMKPLGFTLDEMRELLALLADLDAGTGDRADAADRLRGFHSAATDRVAALRAQLAVAEKFAGSLAGHLDAPH